MSDVSNRGMRERLRCSPDESGRGRAAFSGFFDGFPVFQTEAKSHCSASADLPTPAVRTISPCLPAVQGLPVLLLIRYGRRFDTARNATRARVVRHQNQIAPARLIKVVNAAPLLPRSSL